MIPTSSSSYPSYMMINGNSNNKNDNKIKPSRLLLSIILILLFTAWFSTITSIFFSSNATMTAANSSSSSSSPSSNTIITTSNESVIHEENKNFNNDIDPLKKRYEEPIDPTEFWSVMLAITILVPVGGIFSGLTIGLMSLDDTNLNILKRSGSPIEKLWAERIEPIRKNTHLLLVSLLLGNTIINESLPVLFHDIRLDGYQAVLISTALILLFGEIIPQAVCTRYALAIGAFFAWPLRIFMFLIYIVAYPIAKLLDYVLGTHEGMVYRRAELKELVALHGEGPTSTLTKDEVGILKAVLEIRDKIVTDVMTKLDDVFMLPVDAKLSKATLEQILEAGHSRIPVYKGAKQNLIGVILVKQLLLCDPSEETPITDFKIRRMPVVKKDTPLFDILHIFQEGGSHMALVVDELDLQAARSNTSSIMASPAWTSKFSPMLPPKTYTPLGIITLEDVIEELLGQEIIDETDVYVDVSTKVKVARVIRDLEKRFSASRLFEKKESLDTLLQPHMEQDELEEERKLGEDLTEEEPLLPENTETPIYNETTAILSQMNMNDFYHRSKTSSPYIQPAFGGGAGAAKKFTKKRKPQYIVDPKELDNSSQSEAVVYGANGRDGLVSVVVTPVSNDSNYNINI